MNYPQIASRVLNTPLLLEPAYARVFFSALGSRLNIAELKDEQGAIDMGQKLRVDARTYNKTRVNAFGFEEVLFQVVDGIALLDVKGTLAHKSGYLKPYSGMTGYDGIINRAAMMFAEPDVKGVLMDMHTPGGEVSGCFDTADRLRQMSQQAGKPIWSLACDSACSAGMALASAADRRLITQTGYVGSVGVVMAHASYEDYLEQEGIKVTLIHSGARKTDGNPYKDLPERYANSSPSWSPVTWASPAKRYWPPKPRCSVARRRSKSASPMPWSMGTKRPPNFPNTCPARTGSQPKEFIA